MRACFRCILVFGIAAALLPGMARHATAGLNIAVVASDPGNETNVVAGLQSTGDFSSVSLIDTSSSTPTLSTLSQYDAIFAYTNFIPADPTALGNVLAAYANLGHDLVLSTYGFSTPWAFGGAIMTPGYSPLTNAGVNGDVSGVVVPTQPSPIFQGVNPSDVSFFHNANYAHPGLDPGATLLATDGAGVNMIAQNSAGNVFGMNIYPASVSPAFYQLLANELTFTPGNSSVPEPSSFVLFGMATAILGGWRRRGHRSTV